MTSLTLPGARPRIRFDRFLASQIGSRDNGIDLLRLMAALAVVLGHSWHIALGRDAKPPLQDYTVFGFHSLAVHVFFFLSGLLVTESALRHATSPGRYLVKRGLRIFPALIVNAVLVPIVLVAAGAWTGAGPAEMARYTLRLITLVSIEFEHPGAFAHSPFPDAINGSVWSLRYEVFAYLLVIGASVTGALTGPRRRAMFLGLLFAFVVAGHIVAPHAKSGVLYLIGDGRHVMFSFLLGVAAHRYANRVPLHPLVALPGVALLIAGAALKCEFLLENGAIFVTCAITLLLAYPLRIWHRPSRDISYGVYIYSWPIQQLTVFCAAKYFGIALSPTALFLVCVGPLMLIALASWAFVEKPALALALARPRSPRNPAQ